MKRALGLSLLLHGLFFLWVMTRPPRVLPVNEPPLLVDLFEVAPPTPPPPPPEPEPKPAAPRVVQRASSPPPSPPPQPPPSQPPPVEDDAPRVSALLVPGVSSGAGVVLPLAMLNLDAGYEPQEAPRGLHAPAIPQDVVGEAARERIGRGKVERGMVHPYYVQLGKALIKNWDADRAVSQAGLKGWAASMGENTRTWNAIWKERAAQFGKSGTPFEEPPPDLPMRPVNDRIVPYGGNATDQAAKRELQRQMNMAFKATRRATIRVVQDKDGRLTKVELVDPSNDENVDKEAVADVRAAAQKLPPPPAEALNTREELSSLWSFELVVSISPPVPTITFEFDEVLGFVDPRLPLDRRIYKKVKLVSVE